MSLIFSFNSSGISFFRSNSYNSPSRIALSLLFIVQFFVRDTFYCRPFLDRFVSVEEFFRPKPETFLLP